MPNKLPFLLLLCWLSLQIAKAQQESQYTQFMLNQQAFNPAYAGLKSDPEFYALHRQQWIGYEGAPQTSLFAFNSSFLSPNTGFGLLFSRTSLGISKQWAGRMSYAYQINLGEQSALRFGLEGNMKQYQLDFSHPSVIPLEGNDPVIQEGRVATLNYLNWGSGLYWLHPNFYLGFSIPNMLQQDISLTNPEGIQEKAQEVRHWYFISGFSAKVNEQWQFRSSVLGKYVNNAPFDLDINASMEFQEKITAGLAYRLGGNDRGESIDLLLFYKIKNLGFGMAYDILLSELNNSSAGSFEILCRYHLPKKNKASKPVKYHRFF